MPVSRQTQPVELTPYWQSECGRAVVYIGDCKDILSKMEPDKFHAVVTDPPYGLEFMGMEFDAPWKHQMGDTPIKLRSNGKIETCDEGTDKSHPFRDGSQRVVYGTKTRAKDRRADEMDDPVKAKYLRHNVEYIRDSLAFQVWFQERAEAILRVCKLGAHLLSFGGTRMYHRMTCAVEDAGFEIRDCVMWLYGSGFPKSTNVSVGIDKEFGVDRSSQEPPVTVFAKQWDGYGTALKPAHEPIIVARKDMVGSIAKNVLEHGCGGINIDDCRVGTTGGTESIGEPNYLNDVYGQGMGGLGIVDGEKGRWPANVIHDGSEEVTRLFPECQSTASVQELPLTPGDSIGEKHGGSGVWKLGGYNDSGSAARFFYTSKAGDNDRPHGKGSTVHPTVKPLDLMQYLCRLVCAPGGTVLDPFMGSGSTGCAAISEGMRFVGIELEPAYADIAIGRIKLELAKNRDTLPAPEKLNRIEVVESKPTARKLRGR